MSVTSAGLILLTLIVLILIFAMAGLRQQLRQIQYGEASQTRSGSTNPSIALDSPIAEGKGTQALLLVSAGCPVCHEVAPHFVEAAASAPDIDFVVLTRGEDGAPEALGAARHSKNPRLFNTVDPGWQPALVHVGPTGEVLSVRPVGSPDAMKGELAKLMASHSEV